MKFIQCHWQHAMTVPERSNLLDNYVAITHGALDFVSVPFFIQYAA